MVTDKVYLVMTLYSGEILGVHPTEGRAIEQVEHFTYKYKDPDFKLCIEEARIEDELEFTEEFNSAAVYLIVKGAEGENYRTYYSYVIDICTTKESAEQCIENLKCLIDPGDYHIEEWNV